MKTLNEILGKIETVDEVINTDTQNVRFEIQEEIVKDIKEEALKWIKLFKGKETDCEECRNTETQVYGKSGELVDGESRDDVISWIMYFFNITEEDLI